ncbi:hypothetical protein M3936_03990 [Sutcliffiella horikoshii]|nr:hypothetical protein [Sutcliffiella horikoshii]MCM3616738.1 hypothetical protein [Sutcliffiella horikoshii]
MRVFKGKLTGIWTECLDPKEKAKLLALILIELTKEIKFKIDRNGK